MDGNLDAYVFAGETGQPLWRSSLLDDHIRAKLLPIGLGWVNFQVMRRTHASLGHRAKVDPKVAADQRGHGIGVSPRCLHQIHNRGPDARGETA